MPYVKISGENWLGIELELYNVVGALNSVTDKISGMNLNIEYLETTEVVKNIYKLFVIISSEEDIDQNRLREELLKLDKYVIDLHFAPIYDEIIYSSKHYLKDLGGSRVICLEEGAMHGFIEGIKNALGREAGASLLYHIGHGVGLSLFNKFIGKYDVSEMEKLASGLTALYHGLGWGKIVDVSIMSDGLALSIVDNWECSLYRDKSAVNEGNFTRGVLSGIMAGFTHRKVVAVEKACIATGDYECRYLIKHL